MHAKRRKRKEIKFEFYELKPSQAAYIGREKSSHNTQKRLEEKVCRVQQIRKQLIISTKLIKNA
jgi:hypothetical protein